MAKVFGARRHSARLTGILGRTGNDVARQLLQVGHDIEIDAEQSITAGSISGPGHIPSAPGEPPNADTRFLDGNIETDLVSLTPPRVTVTSHAPYSAALEYGTVNMAARPFMRPALERNRNQVALACRRGVNTAIRRS